MGHLFLAYLIARGRGVVVWRLLCSGHHRHQDC
jgi:hypothetical protein